MVVEDGLFLKACATRLVDAIAEITKSTDAVCASVVIATFTLASRAIRAFFRGEIQSHSGKCVVLHSAQPNQKSTVKVQSKNHDSNLARSASHNCGADQT
jgi:hypothetical protein